MNDVIGKQGNDGIRQEEPRFSVIGTTNADDIGEDMNPVMRIGFRINEMAYSDENHQHYPVVDVEFQQSFTLALGIQLLTTIDIGQSVSTQYEKEGNRIGSIRHIGSQSLAMNIDERSARAVKV